MKKLLLPLFCILSLIGFSQNWTAVEIGQCPTDKSYDVVIADVRNDGQNRLYVSTTGGGIYEWTFTNNQWTLTNTLINQVNGLTPIYAGDGRNDGVIRLYFSEFKKTVGRVVELTWNGSSFDRTIIRNDLQSLGIIVGDGRNDGVNRVYATSVDQGLFEFTYTNGQWTEVHVTDRIGEGNPDIGAGKNDGKMRVYSPTSSTSESSFVNTFGTNDLDVADTWPDALQIAPGRNDGVNRIYSNATGNPGGRKEFSWNGSSWDVEVIEAHKQRGDIHVARLKKDGLWRVYINNSAGFRTQSGPMNEYEWDGSKWVNNGVIMATSTGATAMMTSGNGRNDKIHRMYTPHWTTGGIYEITFDEPFVEGTSSDKSHSSEGVSIYPNPIGGDYLNIKIPGSFELAGSRIEITDFLGSAIYSQGITSQHVRLNIGEMNLPSAFFVMIKSKGEEVIFEKIIRQ